MGTHKVDSHNIPGMEGMRDMSRKDTAEAARLDSYHKDMLHSPGIVAPDMHLFAAARTVAEAAVLVDNMVVPVALRAAPRHAPDSLAPDMTLSYREYQAYWVERVHVLAVSPHYPIQDSHLFAPRVDFAVHRGLAMAPYIHSPLFQAFS